jgi:hypothetical protein
MCLNKEFEDFLEFKAKEIHNETWKEFRVGEKPSCDWHIAKAKEILIGEVIRKYQETIHRETGE